jgi:hypothetical protein
MDEILLTNEAKRQIEGICEGLAFKVQHEDDENAVWAAIRDASEAIVQALRAAAREVRG